MTKYRLRLGRFVMAIYGLASIEWLLFELLRAPYRPPQDMTTFLGTEKYAVLTLMFGLLAGGLGLLCWWAARSHWTRRDVTIVALVIAALADAVIVVIIYPPWPVTPLQWILK